MTKIHPMSVVDPSAELAEDVEIGPFCVVGPKVKIGSGTVLISHVSVTGRTTIGERNQIYPGAASDARLRIRSMPARIPRLRSATRT